MNDESDTASMASKRLWDVIVIGTGMGGATLGHALASMGKSVLFCERGASHLISANAIVGQYPEQGADRRVGDGPVDPVARLRRAGRYIDRIYDESGARRIEFVPFIGSGTGGSTALYGMALERFFPEDFLPRSSHRHAPGSTLEDAWPITYDELSPYYTAAEALYRVKGGSDPLRSDSLAGGGLALDSRPLSLQAEQLFSHLQNKQLHPYRLPSACEFRPDCVSCQGFLCARECKNDSAGICLGPAVADHGAVLLTDCTVMRIDADRKRVTGLICEHHGKQLRLRGKTIVLAAGALQTPNILLRSATKDWPGGLANTSGMVGRNLMRHYIDLYPISIEVSSGDGFDNRSKSFAFNDFYLTEKAKLGSVQSFGRLPPVPMLIDSMKQDMSNGPLPAAARLLPLAAPFLTPVLSRIVERTLTLASIVEDLPYAENRVLPAEGNESAAADIRLIYNVRKSEQNRIEMMRNLMSDALSQKRWRIIKQAHNNQRIAHACGTCRFGSDPQTSVLDRYNRVHDVDNLYVADGSFFPSSGGTNPSLTIAANALRMADAMKHS